MSHIRRNTKTGYDSVTAIFRRHAIATQPSKANQARRFF
jgi:hypothetical protein